MTTEDKKIEVRDSIVLPLKTEKKKFYRQYVQLINPILGLNKRQLDVFGLLLYYHDSFSSLEGKAKWKMLFDYDTKLAMAEELGMNQPAFHNYITALRRKNILKDREINQKYLYVLPKNCTTFELTYKFTF